MTKNIYSIIVYPRTMFENKGIVLKKFNPLNISRGKLTLGMKIKQGLMVRIKKKLIGQQIMTPMMKRLHNRIKLLIISEIMLFSLIEFFTKVSNRVTILT